MIGPSIPAHLLKRPEPDEGEAGPPEAGPSSSPGPHSTTPPAPLSNIGPSIPAHLLKPTQPPADDQDEDEDAFLPALPPNLSVSTKLAPAPARQIGPTFPSRPPPDSDSDDDYGPMPLPDGAGSSHDENDGVREFIEREKRREQQIEATKQPKALKRDDWMLAPPTSSDLFSSLDPTKLKNRQFSRSTTDKKSAASNLWTETPQERQQRLVDEVSGKRKRAEEAAAQGVSATADDEDIIKRRKRDKELKEQVEAHNQQTRAQPLVAMHAPAAPNPDEAPPGIWDHSRDMALSGRLMDEKSRQRMLKDAKGLGDRFGHGRGGGFL
ncbi:hypothetical protein FRC10_007993 [Ceratobasidium sp. 414]|nr:hypothetical protein FRC10_007993 [Ceratobasidium sp. 414]